MRRRGTATAWDPNANNDVSALALSGGTVYAGGSFTSIGGQPRSRIAALDAASGAAIAWDPNANNDVRALAVSGGTVYAGGKFTSIGGQTRNRIAALNAASAAASAWDPNAYLNFYDPFNPDPVVYALAVTGSTVYAGGYFTNVGGELRNRIAGLDASHGAATAWDPEANDDVYALGGERGTVYAGGKFTSVGVQPQSGIAAITDGSLVSVGDDPEHHGGLADRSPQPDPGWHADRIFSGSIRKSAARAVGCVGARRGDARRSIPRAGALRGDMGWSGARRAVVSRTPLPTARGGRPGDAEEARDHPGSV